MPSIKESIKKGFLPAEVFSDLSDVELNKDMCADNINLLMSHNIQAWIKLKKFPISAFTQDYFGAYSSQFKKFDGFNPANLIDQFNVPCSSADISTLTAEQCLNIACLPLRNYLNDNFSFTDIVSLTENERNNLVDPGVQEWVTKGMSIAEARNLTFSERQNITNKNITQFLNEEFTFTTIKALDYQQASYLTNPTINKFIKNGILDIKLLKTLNDNNVKGIVELAKADLLGIAENQFAISEALQLTQNQANNLTSDVIKRLIKNNAIKKTIAINLEGRQRDNLESKEVFSLVREGPYGLTLDQAINLSPVERKMLEHQPTYTDILKNAVTIKEVLKPLRNVEFYEYGIGDSTTKEKDALFQKNLIADLKSALDVLLKDTNNTPEKTQKLKDALLILLRFNPIATVKSIVAEYITKYPNQQKIFHDIYALAEQEFFRTAPNCSRLSNLSQLTSLAECYQHIQVGNDANIANLTNLTKKDLEYGQQKAALAQSLIQYLSKPDLAPTEANFSEFPVSSQGTQRVAALLEKIAIWNANNTKIDSALFRTIRDDKKSYHGERMRYTTPIAGRYQWALPIIFSVATYSKNINEKSSLTKPFYQCDTILYNLSYTNPESKMISTLTDVFVDMSFSVYMHRLNSVWEHGKETIKTTWPRIENLFETIMKMNLKSPTLATDQKAYEENIKDFYAKTAELVWLMGNTQPLSRGSGTVSEILLAVLHHHHGLQPPILKREFPQLDVLNITVPLEDYKKLFTYFFEPETTPECVHYFDLSWSTLPIGKQMELAYEQMNQGKMALESKTDKTYTANQTQTLFGAPKDNNHTNTEPNQYIEVEKELKNAKLNKSQNTIAQEILKQLEICTSNLEREGTLIPYLKGDTDKDVKNLICQAISPPPNVKDDVDYFQLTVKMLESRMQYRTERPLGREI